MNPANPQLTICGCEVTSTALVRLVLFRPDLQSLGWCLILTITVRMITVSNLLTFPIQQGRGKRRRSYLQSRIKNLLHFINALYVQ